MKPANEKGRDQTEVPAADTQQTGSKQEITSKGFWVFVSLARLQLPSSTGANPSDPTSQICCSCPKSVCSQPWGRPQGAPADLCESEISLGWLYAVTPRAWSLWSNSSTGRLLIIFTMRKWVCVTVTIIETHQKSMCRPLLVLPERWTSLVQKARRFGLLGFVVFVLRQAFFQFCLFECLSFGSS